MNVIMIPVVGTEEESRRAWRKFNKFAAAWILEKMREERERAEAPLPHDRPTSGESLSLSTHPASHAARGAQKGV